jgi:hypothetical protein
MKNLLLTLIAMGWFCMDAQSQESSAGTDRFAQLDKNSDGILSADEVASMPGLAQLVPAADADKDGGLSRAELRKAAKRFPGLAQILGEKGPDATAPASDGGRSPIPPNNAPIDPRWGPDVEPRETTLRFTFTPDFFPGTKDANGEILGGTELMRLDVHGGKLFAGVGYFGQDPARRRAPGAQVLRKDSAGSGWVVDATFPDYVRVDTLVSVTFTSDAAGKPLSKPVTRLVAGLWWRKVKPWGTNEEEPTSVAVREDSTDQWTLSTMAKAANGAPGDVRALALHTDAKTGRQYLFAGAGDGRVYRGSYDPAAPGRLRWEVDPGLPKTARLVTFTECDGALYVAGGLVENNGINPMRGNFSADESRRDGGLYRRVDGPDSRWELVYRWPFAGPRFNEHLMRGLSVVPDPTDPAKPVLLGGLEDPPLIQRIDPATGKATDELNYMKYFQRLFGGRPNKGLWVSGAIMNQLEPFTEPRTGERMHFVTTYIMHPNDPEAPHNGAWFLVRKLDGTYAHGYIYPEGGLPSGKSLHGVRTIIESPFHQERGKVWYFGGHGAERKFLHDTAWIYKGVLRPAAGSSDAASPDERGER